MGFVFCRNLKAIGKLKYANIYKHDIMLINSMYILLLKVTKKILK